MYFKRIEMHGFKSFAEPVVIEFHEGVTCIVGPNGSGKSNISDADGFSGSKAPRCSEAERWRKLFLREPRAESRTEWQK